MASKLQNGVYRNRMEFRDDAKLIVSNALLYNQPHTAVANLARQFDEYFNRQWHKINATLQVAQARMGITTFVEETNNDAEPVAKPAPAVTKPLLFRIKPVAPPPTGAPPPTVVPSSTSNLAFNAASATGPAEASTSGTAQSGPAPIVPRPSIKLKFGLGRSTSSASPQVEKKPEKKVTKFAPEIQIRPISPPRWNDEPEASSSSAPQQASSSSDDVQAKMEDAESSLSSSRPTQSIAAFALSPPSAAEVQPLITQTSEHNAPHSTNVALSVEDNTVPQTAANAMPAVTQPQPEPVQFSPEPAPRPEPQPSDSQNASVRSSPEAPMAKQADRSYVPPPRAPSSEYEPEEVVIKPAPSKIRFKTSSYIAPARETFDPTGMELKPALAKDILTAVWNLEEAIWFREPVDPVVLGIPT